MPVAGTVRVNEPDALSVRAPAPALVIDPTPLYVTEAGRVSVPPMVCVPAVITKLAAPPASGMVYTREAAGAVLFIVTVLVTPSTNWLVVAVIV